MSDQIGPDFPFDVTLPGPGQGRLAEALHRQIRTAILDGRLKPGARLPASRRAASALGIARNTVVTAYDLLIAEGYVQTRNRSRPAVSDFVRRKPGRGPSGRANVDAGRLNPAWRTPILRFSRPREVPERSFRLGVPEHRYFPHATWRRLHARILRRWSRQSFTYPPSEGLRELREAIAQHVGFARAVACTPGEVLVTSGAQQAFDLLARVLVTPGQTRVAVEEPGYPPLRAAFAAAGAILVPVPVDEHGLRADRLPTGIGVICVTPSHQAPTGVTMPLARRSDLLKFAADIDAVVVEDDYDGEFRFGARPLDALQTLDRDGRVFYVGTFSKSMFPALRKGFLVAPDWAREALISVKHCADSHSDGIAQLVLADFIREGHLARHVRRMTRIYGERRRALIRGLDTELGEWLEVVPSEAGIHLAALIRSKRRASEIVELARRLTPGVLAGHDYAIGKDVRPTLTFGFGAIDAGEILEPLRRLRVALGPREAAV